MPTTTSIERLWEDFHGELLAFARPRLASAAEAEDVLQVAFLRAHNHLASGTAPNNPRAWLYRIVRNLVADTYRRAARHRETTESEAGAVPEVVDETLSDDDTRALVARALPLFIERLQRPYREALQMIEIEGLTQAAAAARAGVSLSGMKSRVQRARKRLREDLFRCCEFGVDARNRVISCDPRDPSENGCSAEPCDDIGPRCEGA